MSSALFRLHAALILRMISKYWKCQFIQTLEHLLSAQTKLIVPFTVTAH